MNSSSDCYLGNFELKVINVWSIVENSLFKCAVTEGIEFPAISHYNFLEFDQAGDTLFRRNRGGVVKLFGGGNSQNCYQAS